jgi:hypothetical protein
MASTLSTPDSASRYRSAFALRQTTLRAWALSKGFAPATVYAAVRGHRKGKTSRAIVRALERSLS